MRVHAGEQVRVHVLLRRDDQDSGFPGYLDQKVVTCVIYGLVVSGMAREERVKAAAGDGHVDKHGAVQVSARVTPAEPVVRYSTVSSSISYEIS